MTIVFSGSLGADRRMWEPQERAGITGLVLEHPGHGGAPVIEVTDVRDLAAAALARIEAPRFSFVGISLGGAVGMRIALHAPGRLERLALICTSARFGEPQSWRDRAATVREQGLEAIVDMLLGRWFTPEFADVQRYREMFLSTDHEGYARCCDALARWDARDEVAAIQAPTLVVSAADDPAAPPEYGDLLADRIPEARHVVIPNARHLASVERADAVNTLLREHLD
jgi:3-oxoadipate enol-lactonase